MAELATKPIGELSDTELLAELRRIYVLPRSWMQHCELRLPDRLRSAFRARLCIADRLGFDGARNKRTR